MSRETLRQNRTIQNFENKILLGDCKEVLKSIPDGCINSCVTSPPYWGLRDYGVEGQHGLEETPEEYVDGMVEVFREVKRVLRDDGTLWLNLGDSYSSYRDSKSTPDTLRGDSAGTMVPVSNNRNPKNLRLAGLKHKDLVGIPWSVAFALRADGWYLRSDIIWNKPNPMPESVEDRPTKSHEYIFLFAKSEKYFYDSAAIKEKALYGSIERLERGVSEHHKNVNGAPGQAPHSFQRPRPNVRDKRAGAGRIAYGGKRNGENGKGQESFVSIPEMRNKRTVWEVTTKGYAGAHFATFPEDLIKPCILAGSPPHGIVLDPFMGAGTTALVASKLNRRFVGCELNPEYKKIAEKRISQELAQGKFL